jgi:hypothetical protein
VIVKPPPHPLKIDLTNNNKHAAKALMDQLTVALTPRPHSACSSYAPSSAGHVTDGSLFVYKDEMNIVLMFV